MGPESISIFIPAYDEELSIKSVVLDLDDCLKKSSIDYEILLLNDASIDNTFFIMEGLSRLNPRIKVLNFNRRQGLAKMMKLGYRAASKEWVMMVSGDGQFQSAHLDYYFAQSGCCDVVCGRRINKYSTYSLSRSCISRVFNLLARLLFAIPVSDVGWSKMIKRRVLDSFKLKCFGAVVELEILVKASIYGFKISEVRVPFVLRDHGKSKIFKPALIMLSALSMIVLFFEYLIQK